MNRIPINRTTSAVAGFAMACFLLAANIAYTAYGSLGAVASIIAGGMATMLACVIFGKFETEDIADGIMFKVFLGACVAVFGGVIIFIMSLEV